MLPASASAAETASWVLGCASNTVARQAEVIPPLYSSAYRVPFSVLGSSTQEGCFQIRTNPELERMCFVNPKGRQQGGNLIAFFNYLTAR